MIFFFDEHFARRMVRALCEVQIDCRHRLDLGPEYHADVHWLRKVGAEGWVAITQDRNILRTKHEREAVLASGVVAFFVDKNVLTGLDDLGQLGWFARVHANLRLTAERAKPGDCFLININGKITSLK